MACLAIPPVTVLYEGDSYISKSEDDTKLCFLSSEDGILYIYPHFQEFDVNDLFEEISAEINKVLGRSLRSEQHIASLFICAPEEIQGFLTYKQVTEYSADSKHEITYHEIGSKASFSRHSKEALVIVNYDRGETVKYYTPEASFIYAKVVCDYKWIQEDEITKRNIKIVTHNDDTAEERVVSLLEVFKLLTIPQINSLEKKGFLFAKPVILVATPSTVKEIKQWINKLNKSMDVFSGCTRSMIKYRILAHLHYQLQVGNIAKDVYAAATFQFVECSKNNVLPPSDGESQEGSEESKKEKLVSDSEDTVAPDPHFCQSGSIQGHLSTTPGLNGPSRNAQTSATPNQTAAIGVFQSSPANGGQSGATQSSPANGGPSGTSSHASQTTHPISAASSSLRKLTRPLSRFTFIPSSVTTSRPRPISVRFSRPPTEVHRVPPFCEPKARAWLGQAMEDYTAAQDIYGHDACSTEVSATCKHPSLVCFLSHDSVMKCLMGIYYAYIDEGHYFQSNGTINLVQLLDIIKNMKETDGRHLLDVCGEAVMTVSVFDTKCRFPNAHNPPCAPVAIYTVHDAREALASVAKLMDTLKINEILKNMAVIPDPKFRSSLRSSLSAGK